MIEKWNDYPETKPKQEDFYLVTIKNRDTEFLKDGCLVTIKFFFVELSAFMGVDDSVTGWAPLPKPHEKRR